MLDALPFGGPVASYDYVSNAPVSGSVGEDEDVWYAYSSTGLLEVSAGSVAYLCDPWMHNNVALGKADAIWTFEPHWSSLRL